MEGQAMREFAASAPVGHLATVGADGAPHVVPICFALVGDVVYSAVDHKPKRSQRLRRIANVLATGHACLLVDEYDDDWTKLRWVRLDGHGRLVEDPRERTFALTTLVEKYPQYADQTPSGPVLALDVARWSAWSAQWGR